MQDITLKQLAEYCRDYIDLVSPSVMSRGGKKVQLPSDVFSAEPLLQNLPDIDYEDEIVLPINLTTKLSDLAIENDDQEESGDEAIQRDLEIARSLDDVYRKYETNTYTKQLSLQFGKISFKGIPNFGNEEDELDEAGHKKADGYLFSVPIVLRYRDSGGQRAYSLKMDDSLIKTNIGFVKNFMKVEYRDELYKFVAIDANDDNSSIPMSPAYVDKLWTKITTYLGYSEAIDISPAPDMSDVIIALEPKANYFLSQDLSGIIQAADDETLNNTSLSAWVDKNEDYVTTPIDDSGDHELFFPFPYDKYQLQVLTKINNKGIIVEGPPGTGKSQTISNILVHLAATGKKVLFVSQKDQAVRGVKDKLKTLEIPYLYGYMPDRSSRLHTEQDEKDSATYALRGISQSHLDAIEADNPQDSLSDISSHVPLFNNSIDEARVYVKKHDEWNTLDEFEFDSNSFGITIEWHKQVKQLRKSIHDTKTELSSKQKELETQVKNEEKLHKSQDKIKLEIIKINKAFKTKHGFTWLDNEQEYVRGVGYPSLVEKTERIVKSFEETVVDRKVNVFSAKLNNHKLSKELNKTLQELPLEMFETYKTIIFSNDSKTDRRLMLEEVQSYFSAKAKAQDNWIKAASDIKTTKNTINSKSGEVSNIENELGNLNEQLSSILLDDISMNRFEKLFEAHKDKVYTKIHRRHELDNEIKAIKTQNPNTVRDEIMKEKQEYDVQVKNYVRNRLANNSRAYRSQKVFRSALEKIARDLSRTKRAYKTFDRLKSDPFNFEAMSAVTPIWMMGLDDASRILPMTANLFDYVIIDESSQCNISYTLPVMFRAKHTIFFGDTLQMRDTTIAFKSNNQLLSLAHKHKVPEELQIKAEGDSVKSVMDIAKLNGFETTILKKHYRSPRELIGFSNKNFYEPKNRGLEVVNDDILATEDGRVLKTHLVQPNENAEISAKSSLTEAYYIKQLIEKIRSDEHTKDKSIAVLSFFNEQAELLRRVIPDESIKVSAIEGIQGDEADIIIYSFVISSPADKRRYTALTGESGEIRAEINAGRVNVAFSRARLQVHAVTSLAPNLWPDGIWIKKYLEYIEEHGRVNRLSRSEQHFDSKFEEQVYDFLMKKLDIQKYRLSTQAESCGFKIDQVVTDVKSGKKLAIECDGPTHFDDGDGQVRVDSDYERQYVLETAHWVFHRVSYIDWQQHRQSAEQELLAAVEERFSTKKRPSTGSNHAQGPVKEEPVYVPIGVEVPEDVVAEQKERAASAPQKGYFGRKPKAVKAQVKTEEKSQQSLELKEPAPTNPEKPKPVAPKTTTKDTDNNPFTEIMNIELSDKRWIVISKTNDGSYWFNEKVKNSAYSGFTKKGFGLKENDYDEFKNALAAIAASADSSEKRFQLNSNTELVIYRPVENTVDIRQHVKSPKYTGWTTKGIRLSDRNAAKVSELL